MNYSVPEFFLWNIYILYLYNFKLIDLYIDELFILY